PHLGKTRTILMIGRCPPPAPAGAPNPPPPPPWRHPSTASNAASPAPRPVRYPPAPAPPLRSAGPPAPCSGAAHQMFSAPAPDDTKYTRPSGLHAGFNAAARPATSFDRRPVAASTVHSSADASSPVRPVAPACSRTTAYTSIRPSGDQRGTMHAAASLLAISV